MATSHVDRWHYYHYTAPCSAIIDFGSADAGAVSDPGARDQGMRIFACHFITPVDEHRHCEPWETRSVSLGEAMTR